MQAVILLNDSLRIDVIKLAVGFVRPAFFHQPGIFFRDFPDAVRGGNPHHASDAVAVQILSAQAGHILLIGPGAGGGAHPIRGCQVVFRTVAGKAGHDIQRIPLQHLLDLEVLQIAENRIQQIDRHHGAAHLAGVDIGLHIVGGFFFPGACSGIGNLNGQDFPTLGRQADGGQPGQLWMGLGIAPQQVRDFLVAVIMVVLQRMVHG